MTNEEMKEVLANVTYPGYTFIILDTDGHIYLQAHYEDIDIATGQPSIQRTRKWLLSEHMVKSEIVQTAFKCVITSAEHRVREFFKYRGQRIFGPHFDVDALFELAKERRLDYRGKTA